MVEQKDAAKQYNVLISFTDDADKKAPEGKNIYWAGGTYPREGYDPPKERLDYLMGDKTRWKKPVIAPAK